MARLDPAQIIGYSSATPGEQWRRTAARHANSVGTTKVIRTDVRCFPSLRSWSANLAGQGNGLSPRAFVARYTAALRLLDLLVILAALMLATHARQTIQLGQQLAG